MVRHFPSMTLALLAAAMAFLPSTQASLFHPDDKYLTLEVQPDGLGEALPFDEFKRRLGIEKNIENPVLKTEDRRKVEERARALMKRRDLTPDESLALAVDLLRLGTASEGAAAGGWGSAPSAAAQGGALDANEALNRLIALKRGRPNYYVFSTLAHHYASTREFLSDGISHLESAIYDYAPPPPVPGLTPDQQKWQVRIDRDYVLPLLRFRLKEANITPRPKLEDEDVYPLFPPPERGKVQQPVRFVNEAGEYEPGKLAAKEKAKLPPDAIAIVQQLLLWFPRDTRLFWLLGELYAAEGNLEDARKAFDFCVSEAGLYGNRKLLVEHRAAVRAILDVPPVVDTPLNWTMIAGYFAIVAAVVGFAAYRSIRRGLRGCGPAGCR